VHRRYCASAVSDDVSIDRRLTAGRHVRVFVSESSVSSLALRCRLLPGLQNLTPTSAGSGSCKTYAKFDKVKLTKTNLRMCIWVLFQRYKLILNDYKINLNMEDENNYLDEYLTLNKLNLKSKKYLFNY
jgi:hypothetical protein